MFYKFLKKHPVKEFSDFKKKVQHKYNTLGIDFNIINYPVSKENPMENPDHYAIFAYWIAKKILNNRLIEGGGESKLEILDAGNTKFSNMFNSITNNVTALVLEEPLDNISDVKYIKHDISNALPFSDKTFDVFTSPGTLHLIGQGRYGDELNPCALLEFLEELNRVTKDNSKAYIMLPLGKDALLFGYHLIYSYESIVKIFKYWNVTDYMVDNLVKFGTISKLPLPSCGRFNKDTDISNFKIGDYKIIYLELSKK